MAEPMAYAVPHSTPASILSYAAGNPVIAGAAAILILGAGIFAARTIRSMARRLAHGRQPEDVLTVVAAVIATIVQADGMWIFFRDIVPVPVYLRVLMFAFLEVALFTSGLRARRNIKETEEHAAGVDGIAVWVLAGISGTLASTTAGSVRGALLRLTAAAVAAWLWERGLAGERRRARKTDRQRGSRINWRVTPERLLVSLGLAEPAARTAGDVDAHRRLHRVARAAKRLRVLKQTGAASWRQARALRRLDTATARAVEHAGLASDAGRQTELLAQLGALVGAAQLADITPPVPWATPAARPPLRLYRAPSGDQQPAGASDREFPFETPAELSAWLDEDRVPGDDESVPPVLHGGDAQQLKAAEIFANEVQRGKVPGIRPIKKKLGVGQPKAQEVQAYLESLVNL